MLSKREKEVIKLLSEGHSCTKIADLLNISVSTVVSHRENMKEKLKAKNSCNLIYKAVTHGYV